MTEKKYPEEIYPKLGFRTDGFGRLTYRTTFNSDFERAYDLGFKNGKLKADLENQAPLVGWSNLTEAIKAGERIDWERLDGLEAQCVHPELGTLTIRLKLEEDLDGNLPHPVDTPQAWHEESSELEDVIESAWLSNGGWSLWVKGGLPLRKRTADELEPGTGFRARYTKGAGTYTYAWAQVVQVLGEIKVVCFNETFTSIINRYAPANVEVLEVYGPGTFQTPKENQ